MKKKGTVEILLLDKKSQSEIVKLFFVNKAVIYQEIKRIRDE